MSIQSIPNQKRNAPAYEARLPYAILLDNRLSTTARMIAAEISAYCETNGGVCRASNKDFAKSYGFTEATASRVINELVKYGHIVVEYDRAFFTHREIMMTDETLNRYFESLNK